MNRLKVIAFTAFCAVLATGPARAEGLETVEKCLLLNDSNARLGCYDEIVRKHFGEPEPSQNWSLNIEKNKLDGTPTVIARVRADDPGNRPVFFIIRCSENSTEVYISWGRYLGSDDGDFKRVTMKIGNEQPITSNWVLSMDKRATFYKGKVIAMLKNLPNYEEIVARVTPYGENPLLVSFNVKNSRGPIEEVAKACKWQM